MKTFILLTGLIEFAAGVVLFLAPELIPIFQGADVLTLNMARIYGGAALTLSWYAWLVWRNYASGPAKGFLKTFSVFHLLVGVGSLHGYMDGIEMMLGGVVLHGVMWLLTLYFYYKK